MSMGVFVFSDRRLESLREWQRTIESEQLGVVLPASGVIEKLHGFLPVHWSGVATGFECDQRNAREVIDLFRAVHFDRKWAYCLAFNWRGDFDECLAGYAAAAAYAKAVAGIVFDPQDSLVMSDQYALGRVRQMMKESDKWKRATADVVARMKQQVSD
jgi:hypothetical protein